MDWSAFRSQFPVTATWAFLDHAAVSPLPAPAVAALHHYAHSLATNGVTAFREWAARLAHVRRLAAKLINSPDPDDVYFVPNTTFGIGVIAEGFPWQAGDNVVLAAEEYPANQYPWMNLAHRGVEVRTVPSRGSRVAIDDIRARMDASTRSSSPAASGTTSTRWANSAASAASSSSWTRFRGWASSRLMFRRRRLTRSPRMVTSGCSAPRARASGTSGASGSSACTRSAWARSAS